MIETCKEIRLPSDKKSSGRKNESDNKDQRNPFVKNRKEWCEYVIQKWCMVLPEVAIGQESGMNHPGSVQVLKFICIKTPDCCQQKANDKSESKTQEDKKRKGPGSFRWMVIAKNDF